MTWTAPKTDWSTGELVAPADMNAIGGNLAVLRDPATVVYTTTADISSADVRDFIDIDSTNLCLSITTSGGDMLVHFDASVNRSNGAIVDFDVDVDGTRLGDDDGILRSHFYASKGGHSWESASFTRLIQNLNAGSHTFKLQWKISRTAILKAGAQFWVREI